MKPCALIALAVLALCAAPGRAILSPTSVMQTMRSMTGLVDEAIKVSYQAAEKAFDMAFESSETVVTTAVDTWQANLEAGLAAYSELNETVVACKAQYPSPQDVGTGLAADAQACVNQSSSAAQAALAELQGLGQDASSLLDSAEQSVSSCAAAGPLLEAPCLAWSGPPLCAQAAANAAQAWALCASVSAQLGGEVPAEAARCTSEAVTQRGKEAAEAASAVQRCVAEGALRPTTSTEASLIAGILGGTAL